MQTQRRSMEASSEASYYEQEPWEEDWGSRSTLSQLDEAATETSSRPEPESAAAAVAVAAERDALARALAAERQRAAAAARAHDARLAELHGVIAELVRRRTLDRQATAIPEEDDDECESSTQPCGELDLDLDGDHSRTEQNDTTSLASPDAEPSLAADPADPEVSDPAAREDPSRPPHLHIDPEEKDSELCLSTARCCQSARQAASLDSCSREHGSAEGTAGTLYPASPGRCEARQAKMAARVRLKRTEDGDCDRVNGEPWHVAAAEKLALDISSQADCSEALVSRAHGEASEAATWRLRSARLRADRAVLRCALRRASDTAHRLSAWCAVQESSCVTVCAALRAADRALEVYDVLLALAETAGHCGDQRVAAERVANQLLCRLSASEEGATGGAVEGLGAIAIAQSLLSPGPWMEHDAQLDPGCEWSEDREAELRAHAARLKAETVALRALRPPPKLFSYHDWSECDPSGPSGGGSGMAEMEAAVREQEALLRREASSAGKGSGCGCGTPPHRPPAAHCSHTGSGRSGGRRDRHWLDAASETDL